MKIVAVRKSDYKETILEKNLTEKQAWKFCEEWGWNYIDENSVSHWLEIREE